MYQSTTAGTGIVTGAVLSDSGAAIDGALVSSTAGCGSQSVNGYFLLMLPAGSHSLQVTAPGYAPRVLPGVTVGAGQTLEYNIVMTAASSDNGTTCIATRLCEDAHICPAALPLLRGFRDTVLAPAPAGRFFITAYYDLGPDVWRLCAANPALRDRAAALLARAVSNAARHPRGIPPGARDTLSAFLRDCEAVAPAPLRARISDMRRRMRQLPDGAVLPGDPRP